MVRLWLLSLIKKKHWTHRQKESFFPPSSLNPAIEIEFFLPETRTALLEDIKKIRITNTIKKSTKILLNPNDQNRPPRLNVTEVDTYGIESNIVLTWS
jgi:hypothetical protein